MNKLQQKMVEERISALVDLLGQIGKEHSFAWHDKDGEYWEVKAKRGELGDEWQPIETAPRHNLKRNYQPECILVKFETNQKEDFGRIPIHAPYIGYIEIDKTAEFFVLVDAYGDVVNDDAQMPTHWMPLPEPPKGKD